MGSNLYHPEILKLSQKPYRYKKINNEAWLIANNPFCGDRFKVFSEEGERYSFYGHGCAVSKASTSLFVELLESTSLMELDELAHRFVDYIQGKTDICPNSKLEIFSAVKNFPARQDCALLSWKAYLKRRENQG